MYKEFSDFFKLDSSDFVKGLVVAVAAAVFATLAQWFNAPGFDYANFQWALLAKIALTAGISYLGKNLVTAKNGKIFGKIG